MVLRSTFLFAATLACCCGADTEQPVNKVGVINIQQAMVGTKDGQKATQGLDKIFLPKQKEFESRQNELIQQQDQFNKGSSVMSDEKRTQMARDIDEKKKRLQRDMQDAEEDFKGQNQKLLGSMAGHMMSVIAQYSKDNRFSMILDVGNQNTPVLFASSGIDITQDVIALYDQGSGTAPAAPAVTPSKP